MNVPVKMRECLSYGWSSPHPFPDERTLANNNFPEYLTLCSDVDPRYVFLSGFFLGLINSRFQINDFLIIRSSGFADAVWTALKSCFCRQDIIKTEDGVLWKPKRINEIFKITKLISGAPLVPPLAGPWNPNEGEVCHPIPTDLIVP